MRVACRLALKLRSTPTGRPRMHWLIYPDLDPNLNAKDQPEGSFISLREGFAAVTRFCFCTVLLVIRLVSFACWRQVPLPPLMLLLLLPLPPLPTADMGFSFTVRCAPPLSSASKRWSLRFPRVFGLCCSGQSRCFALQIDRCYAWKSNPDGPARISLDNQEPGTAEEFENRAARIRTGKSASVAWQIL